MGISGSVHDGRQNRRGNVMNSIEARKKEANQRLCRELIMTIELRKNRQHEFASAKNNRHAHYTEQKRLDDFK